MERTVALAGVALLAVTAGCLGFVLGEEPKSFEATPATVEEGTVEEAGYEGGETQTITEDRTFTVEDQSRTVEVVSHLVQYHKNVSAGPVGEQRVAALAVLSTPEVNVLGETFNPVGDMSDEELVEQFTSRYDSVTVGDRVGETEVSTLGTETGVSKFEGTARVADGTEVPVYVHVTKVNHDGDYVVVLAVYPQALSGESETVLEMIRALEH